MTTASPAIGVGSDAAAWIDDNLTELREMLDDTGVLRLRELGDATAQFDAITSTIVGSPTLEYHGGATPRTRIDGNVYSSTDFPSRYAIDLHSEMAYATQWPLHLAFCCEQPSETGGATPLASTSEIARRVPDRLADRLREHGVRYRRAFHPMLGADWRHAYDVDDLDQLTAAAQTRGESVEFVDETVTTSWTLPAYLTEGDDELWFNQMVAFNVATLPADVREDLLLLVGEDGIPKNTLLGDGTPFDDADIEAVRRAVADASVAIPWNAGDLTIVDNRKFAHGRESFTGARDIRVCMTGAGTWR